MSGGKHRKRHEKREIVPSTGTERVNGGGFAPGNKLAVGNTGARKHRLLTQQLISRLHDVDVGDKKGRRQFEIMIDKLMARACNDGDMDAIKFIFERVDGKITQPIGLGVEELDGMSVTLRIGHRSPDGAETVAQLETNNGRKQVQPADGEWDRERDRRDFGEVD